MRLREFFTMIISDISLENIRSHNNTHIRFTEGINIITGNTGSGKSSILMSIEYALFGKIGEGREEGKIILRRNSKEGKVKLNIIDGNHEYSISRGLKRINENVRNDDSKNYIDKDGVRVDLQNRASDINSYVNKLLKIDADNQLKMFETITYIKQDELKNLIFETDQYKQEYIDGLLQLNKYLSTYESMRDLLNKIKTEIDLDKKEVELSINQDEIIKTEKKIDENKNEIEDIKKKIYDWSSLLEKKQINKKQKESEIEFERSQKVKFTKISTEIKIKREEKEKFLNEIEKNKNKIEENSKEIVDFDEKRKELVEKSINDLETSINNKNEEIKKIYAEMYKAEYSYKNSINELENLKKEEKNEETKISEIEKELEEIRKQLELASESENRDEIKGRITEIEKIKKETEKELYNAIKTKVCQLCGKEINDEDHIKNEYKVRIDYYDKTLLQLRKSYDELKISKTELQRKFDLLSSKNSSEKDKLASVVERISIIDTDKQKKEYDEANRIYKESKERLDSISNELKNKRNESAFLNKQEKIAIEIKNYGSRIKELEDGVLANSEYIEKLNFELNRINFDEENLKNMEDSLKLLNNELTDINNDIARLKNENEMREKQVLNDMETLKELESKMKRKEEAAAKLQKKESLFKLLSNLREDIRSIREYVRLRFINEFRSLFKSRFEELRNESDYSIDIDNNYNVVISSGNEEMDARTLSGGEKTSVAIAYRLALSSLAAILGGVGKNELIVMDEPTSGLDKEDINALTNAITRINDLKQIIIVTHEDNMKNIADNVIKLKKDSGSSIAY